MQIIVATHNSGKLREIKRLAGDDVSVVSMSEAGLDPEILEDGMSFTDNALKKCRSVWDACGEKCMVLADDSGLCIDYFQGGPGIFSARWMGEDTDYETKCAALIAQMSSVPAGPARAARFTCAIAVKTADGREYTVERSFEGEIAFQPAGCGGFGYDPIFYLPERGVTSAELTADEKNLVSHRGKALRAAFELLRANNEL